MGRNPLWYREYLSKTLNEMAFIKYVNAFGENKPLTHVNRNLFYKDVIEYLNFKSIYDCREIATRFRLSAPTATKKEDLTKMIAAAVWGVQDFDKASLEDMLVEPSVNDKFTVETEIKIDELYLTGAFVAGREMKGYMEITDKGFGVVRSLPLAKSDRDAYCTRKMVHELNLKNGDYIVCRVKYDEEIKSFYTYHIDSVNDIPVDDFNRIKNRAARTKCEPDRRVILKDTPDGLGAYINTITPLMRGQSLLVSYSGTPTTPDNVINLTSSLKDNAAFDEVVLLCLGEREKNGAKAKPFVMPNGFVPAGDEERCTYVARRAADYVRGEAERGKNVCLVVNALFPIATKAGLCEYLISSASAYVKGGSATVICFVDREVAGGSYGRVKRLSDGELRLDYFAFLDSFEVDVENSYTNLHDPGDVDDREIFDSLRYILSNKGAGEARKIVSAQKTYDELTDAILRDGQSA